MKTLFLSFLILIPTFCLCESRPSLRAAKLTSAFRLDGKLDDSDWQKADVIQDLTMVEPTEGSKPSATTKVRVLADEKAIIFGVECQQQPSTGIVSFSKKRDADLTQEDHIRMVIDTFQDGQSGYIFAVNPSGARYDALVSNRGESENSNWDGIWEVATFRNSDGWSVEIQIPIQTLNFKKGLSSWYFNIQRRIQRKQETDRWASAKPNYELPQTSRAGMLTNLPSFDLGLGFSIRPSVVGGGGTPDFDSKTEYTKEISLDATKKLGPNLLSSLTINTDFAETEVDERQVNLTRFPLFFPEKRTFFLEGADIFEFGLGLSEDLIPFFSRRIGLVDGIQVPIVAGGKLNGRIGRTSIGSLVVRTGDEEGVSPDTTLGVVRVKQNIWKESSFGFIGTAGDPNGINGSWLSGVDFTYQTSTFRGDKNFLVGLWGTLMDRDGLEGNKSAYGFKIDYPNDLWDIAFSCKRIGDGFDPSLGFVPRSGIFRSSLSTVYSPRPRRYGIRQMFHEFFVDYFTDLSGIWESYEVFMAPINWRMETGDRFEFNVIPQGERLIEPFEISEGVVIPPGRYQWHSYRVEFQSASKRKFSGLIAWRFGEFFDGSLDRIVLQLVWNPVPLFTIQFSSERNLGDLPAGNFTEDLYASRVTVNFSPDLELSSLLQYDTISHSFGSNTRLRWTFHPLGDVFVVYNHNLVDIPKFGWRKQSNELLVKFQYTFRK